MIQRRWIKKKTPISIPNLVPGIWCKPYKPPFPFSCGYVEYLSTFAEGIGTVSGGPRSEQAAGSLPQLKGWCCWRMTWMGQWTMFFLPAWRWSHDSVLENLRTRNQSSIITTPSWACEASLNVNACLVLSSKKKLRAARVQQILTKWIGTLACWLVTVLVNQINQLPPVATVQGLPLNLLLSSLIAVNLGLSESSPLNHRRCNVEESDLCLNLESPALPHLPDLLNWPNIPLTEHWFNVHRSMPGSTWGGSWNCRRKGYAHLTLRGGASRMHRFCVVPSWVSNLSSE